VLDELRGPGGGVGILSCHIPSKNVIRFGPTPGFSCKSHAEACVYTLGVQAEEDRATEHAVSVGFGEVETGGTEVERVKGIESLFILPFGAFCCPCLPMTFWRLGTRRHQRATLVSLIVTKTLIALAAA
jgi:hypothetical protein